MSHALTAMDTASVCNISLDGITDRVTSEARGSEAR